MAVTRGRSRPVASKAQFNGVKVFSATMLADRERLGEKVSAWIAGDPRRQINDMIVTQSSDAAFHCVAITIFYFDPTSA
jgi:hypothetical protein